MIGKLFKALFAQLNKIVSFFYERDPIAIMKYEYERAKGELKEGRDGLVQYRALTEKFARDVANKEQQKLSAEGKVAAYLQIKDRANAATMAVKLKEIITDLAALKKQLSMHETSYQNNVKKIQHAEKKLAELKDRTAKYEAELKISGAEAKMAEMAASFDFNSLTTDIGDVESILQGKIDKNRAKVRVASDLSSEGIEEIKHDEAVEAALAENALKEFEAGTGAFSEEGWSEAEQDAVRKSMSDLKETVVETPTPTTTPSGGK